MLDHTSFSRRLHATLLVLASASLLLPLSAGAQVSVRVGPMVLDLIEPTPFSYEDGVSFTLMNLMPPGTAQAPVTVVNVDLGPGNSSVSGCSADDFLGFPAGNIALIQRGGCTFAIKANNAADAGASAILIFNQGLDGTALQQGLLTAVSVGADYTGSAPTLFLNYPLGEALANTSNPVMRVDAPVFRGTLHEAYLRYCMGNRDHCSLSVKHLNSGWERSINTDRLQVTASVYKILMLVAYAEAVVAGDLDPATVIPRDDWARFSVRRDGGALQSAFNRFGSPESITLDQMMSAMLIESDNAAPDWLLAELGRARVAEVAARFMPDSHDPPEAINAFFVTYDGHPLEPNPAPRILASYPGVQSPGYRQEVADMFELMDTTGYAAQVRDHTCVALPWTAPPPGCVSGFVTTTAQYQQLLGRYFTRANSSAYAGLMEGLLQGTLVPANVYALMEPHLEWFFVLPGVPDNFARYGGKGGSFGPQNVCNFSGFVESLDDGEQIVVSTFVRDSLHSCGFGLSARTFMEQMALDSAFRALVQNDEGWDSLLFRSGFEDRLAVKEMGRSLRLSKRHDSVRADMDAPALDRGSQLTPGSALLLEAFE